MAEIIPAQKQSMRKPYPTQERLREILQYDPETGSFYWAVDCNRLVRKGDKAGFVVKKGGDRSYVLIQINGVVYRAHNIAWIYVYGGIPDHLHIDHIDRIGTNNKISNLRLATRAQNDANKKAKPNSNGYRGVHKNNKKWMSQISINGVCEYLGTFDSPSEAHEAYKKRAIEAFGEFAFTE